MRSAGRPRIAVPFKTILIIEIVISYIALLTLISYMRAPQEYGVETDAPLLSTADFISLSGEAAEKEMLFLNGASGGAVGYQGELELRGIDRLHVVFKISCPAAYAGRTVYVDIYNYEGGYDSPEQEVALTLQEGDYSAELTLFPGEGAPASAQLRIFTVEPAEYLISEVTVCEETPLPKISTMMLCIAGTIWLCTVITAVCCWHRWIFRKQETKRLEHGGENT